MFVPYLIAGIACIVFIPLGAAVLFMFGLAGVCNMIARGEYGERNS